MQRRFLPTMQAVGKAVHEGRKAKGWSQAQLALEAGVGRRFIVDRESGHLKTGLEKVLMVLESLDIHAAALPSISSG